LYLLIVNGRENDGAFQLFDVCLFVFLHVQKIDQEILQSLVLGAEFELLTLEYQNWLQLVVNVLWFELGRGNVIFDLEFEHVQEVIRV